jgi:flagellar biosynthetic protein FliQ
MMENEFVLEVVNQAIKITLMLSAPMLIAALVVGVLASIFQAVTQINEQTLPFIPKILVIIATLVIFSPWMMETMVTYTQELFTSIPELIRR